MMICHFRAQNGPFALNNFFLVKTVNISFIQLLALFMVQNFKNILRTNPELWGCTIFESKMAHLPPKYFFFWKPINNTCSFHWCLSKCQKSKSNINLVMKYWWSKNTEISLVKSHFWLWRKNQIFPSHAVFVEC